MCGIFGLIFGKDSGYNHNVTRTTLDLLFKLSESRGKEAAGFSFLARENIYVGKYPIAATNMIARSDYRKCFDKAFNDNLNPNNDRPCYPLCFIGHSRLVTNGAQQIHHNNQPVISRGMVGVHNGIITNVDELWTRFPMLKRNYDIDTEILLCFIEKYYNEKKYLIPALKETFKLIEGAASVALQFAFLNNFVFATNCGSLYLCTNLNRDILIFASEQFILKEMTKRTLIRKFLGEYEIRHIEAGKGCLVNLDDLNLDEFSLNSIQDNNGFSVNFLEKPKQIIDVSSNTQENITPSKMPGEGPYVLSPKFVDEYPGNRIAINQLRRCSRCVLPETMPFIDFDENGVCNYCRSYRKNEFLGLEALQEKCAPYRKRDGKPECLVTFSGGRDSSYGVHFVKKILNMNPVTYTYDWGMVTDLARRNQMRICGKLGIEHILVSADIAKKRKFIRQNVSAWLKKPDLGTIPLFMAGDKQYFYYANKIGKQTESKIVILCENPLETTRFKSGYCGIRPDHGSRQTFKLAFYDKLKLGLYYGKQYISNPSYINSSIFDTLGAYCSYYFIPHNYLDIYRYIKWDEDTINNTLIDEYNWEVATDTKSTWRIGDGTASFYNYIYYTMSGLTENDTFRSNQIREGILNRENALQLVESENAPRYESIQWYCDIIGIDFEDTIERINLAPKLY